tara:strand:- start:4358 stop:5770 length:1413 start_codon:yes stop_codon:yes gene_type:complete
MINPNEIKSNTNLSNGLNIKPEVLPTKATIPVPLVTEPLVSEPLPMPKFGAEATSYYETLQPRYAELVQAEGELKKFEMQNEAAKTRNQFEATKVYKTNVDALNLTAEQKENEYPRPEFHPTKENLASLGSLFSMVSTLGMIVGASGKMGANNAMNAMTGMLKGWQSGRKDLYEKEVKEFDKEYKRITDIRNEIQKKLEKSIALESTNKELAFLEREGARQLAGSDSVMGKTIAVKGAKAGIDLIINATNVETQYQKLASDAKNRAEDRALRLQIAELKSGAGTGGKIAKEVVQAHTLRENLIPALEEAVPVLRRLNDEGKWNTLSNLLRSQEFLNLNQSEWGFKDDPGAINLIRTLAFFRSKEFETAGKALTKTENNILAPLYQAGARPFEAMENNLLRSLSELNKEQLKLERQYPRLQLGENVTLQSPQTQTQIKPMPTGDKLKTYATNHFNGDEQKAKDYLATQGYR